MAFVWSVCPAEKSQLGIHNRVLMQAIALDDRWLLPLQGQVVIQSYAFPGLIFNLEGAGRSYELRMHGNAQFTPPAGPPVWIAAETWSEAHSELIDTFEGVVVDQALAYEKGPLELTFTDQSMLSIFPDPKYESWELVGKGDLRVVGCPEGEVAVWHARSGDL